MRGVASGLVLVSGALLLGGCAPTARDGAPRPAVAVSVFPLYDLTRRVAGEDAEVDLLLPPGGDVHGGGLSPRGVVRLSGARLIVGVGPGFDAWTLEAARRAGAQPDVLWVGGSDVLPDPHVWLDPVVMQGAVRDVAEALAGLDPPGAPRYRERAERLAGELAALDEGLHERTAAWPSGSVVTAHAFLGPFAARYGVDVAAVLEPVPGRELTPGQLSEALAAIAAADDAAAILVPAGESGAAARVASEETGLPVIAVDVVGGRPGDRYETVLEGLADALEGALESHASRVVGH